MGLFDRFRKPPPPPRSEKGRSGTVNTRGFLTSDELNRNLIWPRNLDIYDEMRKTDPTIRWMTAIVKNPILASPVEVEPASDDPEDMEIAGFVDHALNFHLEGGLTNFLRQALLYLDYGHYAFEMSAETRSVEFTHKDAKGEEQTVTRDAFVIADLAPRLPRTIQKWNTPDDNPRKLLSIEQWLPNGQNPIIEADRLVLFVNEREGDDFRGTSLLRSAYKSYRYKTELENIEAVGLERSAGFLVCYPPSSADDDQLDEMEDMLRAARQGENLYALMPGPKAAPDIEDGWTLEDLAVSGDGSKSSSGNTAAGAAISRHEASMARNVLAEFMRLGHDGVGARATGDVQQDPYWQAVEAVVDNLEQVILERVIAPLVAWNYDTKRLPRLRFSKIQAKNVQVIAEAWTKLVSNRAVVPSVEDENWIRNILDAPQRKPPEEGEDDGLGPVDLVPVDPNDPDADPEGKGKTDPAKPPKDRKQTTSEFRPKREPEGVERFVDLASIAATLDAAQAEMLNVAVRASRGPVSTALSTAQAATTPEAIEGIAIEEKPIEEAILGLLHETYMRGRSEVAAELRRQGAERFEVWQPVTSEDRLRRLAATAALAAASMAAAANRAIRAFAIRRLETRRAFPVGPGYDPDAAVRQAARGSALNVIPGVFGDGRRDEQVYRKAEISMAVYSAILDTNTCRSCTRDDGREGPPGGDPTLPTPNPGCEGGGACRCMWIPVLKRDDSAVAYPLGVPAPAIPQAA